MHTQTLRKRELHAPGCPFYKRPTFEKVLMSLLGSTKILSEASFLCLCCIYVLTKNIF